MDTNEVGKSVKKNVTSLLSNKPMWAFWIFYSALCGILFGIFYTAMYLVALQWWIPVIVIIAIGMIWGSFAYNKNKSEISDERVEKTEAKKETKKES